MRRLAQQLGRQGGALLQTEPCLANKSISGVSLQLTPPVQGQQLQQQRGLQLLKLFSKEGREERRERLREDLQRGYFDDFKELKDTKGKLFRATDRLIPASAAPAFPRIEVLQPDGTKTDFPPPPEHAPAASLVCIGFKAGSEAMLASWSDPFVSTFRSRNDAALVELSVVESKVMSLWPFRSMILRAPRRAAKQAEQSPTAAAVAAADPGGTTPQTPEVAAAAATADDSGGAAAAGSSGGGAGLRVQYLFYFHDARTLCKAVDITNRLTGYAFLLDRQGRVRFRGCGKAEPDEQQSLIEAAQQLLDAG